MMEQYVTVAFAASMMLCTPTTIRRWIRAGKIPAIRVGERGRYRIPLMALLAQDKDRLLLEALGLGTSGEEQ